MTFSARPKHLINAPRSAPPTSVINSSIIKALITTRVKFAKGILTSPRPPVSWKDLCDRSRIPLPTSPPPYTIENALLFVEHYSTSNAPAAPVESAPTKTSFNADKSTIDWGGWQALPQQAKAINYIYDELFIQRNRKDGISPLNAILLPLNPGDGKGVIASVLCLKVLREIVGIHESFYNIIVVTPSGVLESTRRKFLRAGFTPEQLRTSVVITSYSQLRSAAWKGLFKETQVTPENSPPYISYSYIGPKPALVILDESHLIKNQDTKAYRYCRALAKSGAPFVLTSGTPAVTVADMRFFALCSGVLDLEDQPIQEDSWPIVARYIAKGNPADVNTAAMERFNQYFSSAICRPPRDPRKVKCTNRITVEAMPNNPELQKIYYEAEYNWIVANKRAGIQVSEAGARMASWQILRAAAELLTVPILVDRVRAALSKNLAPVVGVSFQATLRELTTELVDQNILPRNQISILWGGKPDIRLDQIYNTREFLQFAIRDADTLTRAEIAKLRRTRQYNIEQMRLGLNRTNNEARLARYRELSLNKQTRAETTLNMDRFQDGSTKTCLFTLPTGGTGIDLDQQIPTVPPRCGIFTPCFYGEEFLQAFNRLLRRGTLSDVDQEIIVLDKTIVSKYVVPSLMTKIGSLRTLAAGAMDFVALLESKATLDDYQPVSSAGSASAEAEDIEAMDALEAALDDETDEEN